MWNKAPISVLNDQMLHPYTECCPGVPLDFYGMESACGIAHIPYGAEIAHRRKVIDSLAIGVVGLSHIIQGLAD